MKIIVENSGYGLDNLGDVAMLQMAVSRLNELWPNAEILVITSDRGRVCFYTENAQAFDLGYKRAWLSKYNLVGGLQHLFPSKLKDWLSFEESFRVKWPDVSLNILALRFGRDHSNYLNAKRFVDEIKSADLVIATGGGYVNDTFDEHSSQLFDVLLLAQKYKIPTAMLGQGLGPISNKKLMKKFKRILSNLGLITMREGRFSPQVLKDLTPKASDGIPANFVTGDDAVEKAFNLRPEKLGNQLGLNIRDAAYAHLPEGAVDNVGEVIRNYLHKHALDYQLLPISLIRGKSDLEVLEKLMNLTPAPVVDTDLEVETVIKRVGHCRVVVTGSYHAALFALAQGVQVVGLTASKYYDSKFLGLLEQFHNGVQLVYLNEGAGALTQSIETAWERADAQRDGLLEAAEAQIQLGKSAYSYLQGMTLEKI